MRGFRFGVFAAGFSACLLAACSFNYGDAAGGDSGLPDMVMENVEYVRVRSLDKQAKFNAERAERYEKKRLMNLRNLSFEQYDAAGDISAAGGAGSASVELDSMDILMSDGVKLDIDSEDMSIETSSLQWKDKDKTLAGGTGEEVRISSEDGTSFSGIGFLADVRRRTWEFAGKVTGTYVHEDDDGEGENPDGEIPAANGNSTIGGTADNRTDGSGATVSVEPDSWNGFYERFPVIEWGNGR